MQSINVVFFDAGGGHRSVALALSEAIRIRQQPWLVELVNLQHVLEDVDLIRKATGFCTQDVYNWSLRQGWTRAPSRVLPAMHGMIRILHKRIVGELSEFWSQRRPDLVVSVVPHFSRAIHESVTETLPETPLVTVMTDLADHPPHFWLERQNQYFVCGSHVAVEQARGMGIPQDRILRVSGMAIHPRFYTPIQTNRAVLREQLGLDPELATGLVLFGGYGSKVMLDIMARLATARLPVQLILLCGRNPQLAEALEESKAPIRRVVRTYIDDIAHFMHLSDFFIGKPGPGSVTEALAMKLPVILERNARTMVQERYNCDWVEERGVGVVVDSFSQIARAVAGLLNPPVYAGFRKRIDQLNNRAVFEIPEILERILEDGPKAAQWRPHHLEEELTS